jgi:hypothetical protein
MRIQQLLATPAGREYATRELADIERVLLR